MNKKHLILPLVACLMLAGCTLGKTTKKKKKSTSGSEISEKSDSEVSQSSSGKEGSSGTSTPAPADDWSSSDLEIFTTYYGGIVPPYLQGGLDPEYSMPEYGICYGTDMTQTQTSAYLSSLSSKGYQQGTFEEDGSTYYYKVASDESGEILIYDNTEDDSVYYIVFQWYELQAVELSSIAVSGQKETFDEQDAFSFGGKVTATYDDESTADVTSKAQFSGYDMSKTGSQTVTVSYTEGDVTKTTSYSITVNAIERITVKFDGNGVEGEMADDEALKGKPYTLPASKFTEPADKGFVGWNTKADGTGTAVAAGGTYTVTEAITFYAQWKTKYEVSFKPGTGGDGEMASVYVIDGKQLSKPACTFTAPEGMVFDKWVDGEGTEVTFPLTVTSAVELTATWKEKVETEVTDTLTQALIGISGTVYAEFNGKKDQSKAVYGGNCAGDKSSIQLRSSNSNSGIVSTTSGGKIKSVTVVWQADTASGRTLDVYGSNTAFTSATQLYNVSSGSGITKIGSIVKGTSTSLEVTGEYAYIGLRSNTGAMYLTSISIVWLDDGSDPVPPTPVESNWEQVTTKPAAAGGDYLFGFNNGTIDKFVDGGLSSSSYPTVTISEENAIHFTLEAASGDSFYLKVTSAESAVKDKYLCLIIKEGETKNSVIPVFQDDPVAYDWVVTETSGETEYTANTLGVKLQPNTQYPEQYYILATYGSFPDSISAAYNKHWEGDWICRLYTPIVK